ADTCSRGLRSPSSYENPIDRRLVSQRAGPCSGLGSTRVDQRRTATPDQIASITPKGQAPRRKPYAEPRAHAAAKARTNQRLRTSSAKPMSMAVTEQRPHRV